MVLDETYSLFGYIEYISSTVGFVTPVFKSDEDTFYVQVSSGKKRIREWELLPSEYHPFVLPVKENNKNHLSGYFLYGFKCDDSLIFASGKEMAEYLSTSFLPSAKDGIELAKGFIRDWVSLDPVVEEITKERIWKNCLDLIGKDSKTMPGIFLENFSVIEFYNGVLTLSSKNDSVKKAFESKFQEQLISYFSQEIPDFKIDIIQETNILPTKQLIYYGGGRPLYSQGSFIVETKIKSFQDFDNFIVSSFNTKAYHQAVGFIESETSSILTIRGAAGVGKTHLVNSIAKHFTEKDTHNKVGVYTVFSKPENKNKFTEFEIEQFEITASANDIIIIDDAHNIDKETYTAQRLIKILKRWRAMNKSIVLSFRDSLQVDFVPELIEDSEQLILFQPSEDDKLKFIESKINTYNIQLSGRDILTLSEDRQLQNFTDIQRYLTRAYLAEEFRTVKRNVFLSYQYETYFTSKLLESLVYDHFRLNQEHPYFVFPEVASLNARIISHFIQDLFLAPHHGSRIVKETDYIDGIFYSFDAMQYYLFESEPFKKTILEILREVILNRDEYNP